MIDPLINYLNNIIPLWNWVPVWRVLLIGLPVALAVHFVFNLRKSPDRGWLQPILWVVLTVAVLLFWNSERGNGKDGKEPGSGVPPVAEPVSSSDAPRVDTGESSGGTSTPVSPKPIALKITANENDYTIEDMTNQVTTRTQDYVKWLNTKEEGYRFERIETENLTQSQFEALKKDYPECKVETSNK
ncbi:MAG: hypothetical protein K6C40_11035 [Thermoguttaceae bacterium]|nr:hypothetical protein [Thermoguttaceae bacterium]